MIEKWESESRKLKVSSVGDSIQVGKYWNQSWNRDPKSILFMLSRYKFAAKLISQHDSVLEIGCGEGLGSHMIAQSSSSYLGIDHRSDLVDDANKRLAQAKCKFQFHDILESAFSIKHHATVAFDVIEHIYPNYQHEFISNAVKSTYKHGLLITGIS